VGGVTGTVSGTVTGLPSGVTVAQPTFTGTVNSDVIFNFSAASTATTSGSATITVTNGTLSATANIPITVDYTPDFTFSSGIYTGLGVYQSSIATFTASVTDLNGFNQPIAVSFELHAPVRCFANRSGKRHIFGGRKFIPDHYDDRNGRRLDPPDSIQSRHSSR
jgi:hypothetical protein